MRIPGPGWLASLRPAEWLTAGVWECRLLFDLLVVFLAVVPILALFLLSVTLFPEVVQYGLSGRTMLRLLPYALPDALRYAIPAALLLAVSRVYSGRAADLEIASLKACGVSPIRILWPGMGLGLLLSPPVVWLTDYAVSWGHDGVQRVVMESVAEMALAGLRTQRSYATPRFSLAVRGLDGMTLLSPTLQMHAGNKSEGATVRAAQAKLLVDRRAGSLRMIFEDGSITLPRAVEFFFPDRYEVAFSLREASTRGADEHFSLRTIFAEIERSRRRIAELERQSAASSPPSDAAAGEADVVSRELARERVRLNELRSKPHRRWAHGFSCLAFATFGIPWAARSRDGDLVHAFFLGFAPVLLFYYPIEMALASNACLPPYSVWIADGLLLVSGWVLLRQFWRH